MTHLHSFSLTSRHDLIVGKKLTILFLAGLLAGCESIPKSLDSVDQKTVSTMAGAALGCVGGVLMTQIVGGDRSTACVLGAAAGGILGFERARRQELADAAASRQEIITTIAPIAKTKGVRVGDVKTQNVSMKTDDGKETKNVKAFDSLTIELPTTTQNRPEHAAAVEKLRKLAEKMADERGSADIILAVRPEEAKARNMSLTPDVITTSKGKKITFMRKVDASVPKGVERVTVQAGPVRIENKTG